MKYRLLGLGIIVPFFLITSIFCLYKDDDGAWVPLEPSQTLDYYTRIENDVFCGEMFCDVPPMQGVDASSFEVWVGTEYARDKHNVYYPIEIGCGDGPDCGVCYCTIYIVEDANPKTFKYLDKDYATDGRNVYFRGELLKHADAGSFQVIVGPEFFYFAKDQNNVYKHDDIFPEADPTTFYRDENQTRAIIIGDKNNKWHYKPPNTIIRLGEQP